MGTLCFADDSFGEVASRHIGQVKLLQHLASRIPLIEVRIVVLFEVLVSLHLLPNYRNRLLLVDTLDLWLLSLEGGQDRPNQQNDVTLE